MAGVPGYDPTRLFTALQNTGLSNKDNPLYQVIYLMIQQLINLTSLTSGLTPGGGGSSSVINNLTQQLLLSENFSNSGDDNSLLPVPGQNVTNVITQIIQQLSILDSFSSSGDDNQLLSVPSQSNIVNNLINSIIQQINLGDFDNHENDDIAIPLHSNVAFTNQPNIFIANQLINSTRPMLSVRDRTNLIGHLLANGDSTLLTNNIFVDSAGVLNLDDTSQPGSVVQVSSGVIAFYTAPAGANPAVLTQQVEINTVNINLLRGQIQFPATQNPSSDPNTLDDYEEGTWTPVIGGTGGQTGQTYTRQDGSYVKIGQQVLASWDVILSNKGTITGGAQISTLPFASQNISQSGTIGFFSNLAVAYTFVGGAVGAATSVFLLFGTIGAVTTVTGLTTTDIANTTRLIGYTVYRAAA